MNNKYSQNIKDVKKTRCFNTARSKSKTHIFEEQNTNSIQRNMSDTSFKMINLLYIKTGYV